MTKYNVQKHGILGTLKNEVVEVGQDVRDLGHTAKEAIQKGAPQVPGLVRAATDTMGNVVQSGTAAAASTEGIQAHASASSNATPAKGAADAGAEKGAGPTPSKPSAEARSGR